MKLQLLLSLCLLTSAPTASWLAGTWQAADGTAYQFQSRKNSWQIKVDHKVVSRQAKLTKNKQLYILKTEDGKKYRINKTNKREITVQQQAKKGYGLTQPITLKEK
ncbi:hypothetical protein [Enterococcus sp. CSURQ0835]|uniref:hypothetical protein n=1 Tax=Enterococcus sp. CSURQ0835 TaxID=2681394 RepID=UPI0013597E37|nr:hypothetical protein [Enterococcus sp. CSURQ0835]